MLRVVAAPARNHREHASIVRVGAQTVLVVRDDMLTPNQITLINDLLRVNTWINSVKDEDGVD